MPPERLSWYGDPAAPDLSGAWVRADAVNQGATPESNEGWTPWPPPLQPPFVATWQTRMADAAAGKRTDDPVRACLPPGMPRFITGTNGPLQIIQTPGRVVMYRDGDPVRRIWLDGRPLPKADELESFSNGTAATPIACQLFAGILFAAVSAFAHHSFAMFDQTKEVTLKGATVVDWQWTSPHAWLYVLVPNDTAEPDKYSVECANPGVLRRDGFEKNSMAPGDKLTIYMAPLKSGEKGGSLNAVVLTSGKMLGRHGLEVEGAAAQ